MYRSPHKPKFNHFRADSPGDVELSYRVQDVAAGYESESPDPQKVMHIVERKLVIDSPSPDTTFWITPEPEMPQISCKAHLEGVPIEEQADLVFNWQLDFAWSGGNLNFEYESTGSIEGPNEWIPDFGSHFAGGHLSLTVSVRYQGVDLRTTYGQDKNINVWGHNPHEADAIAYLRSGYSQPDRARQAEVIGLKESNYQQFQAEGQPNVSGDGNGVGLMQMTPPPSPDDYWSWTQNVDDGKDLLQDKWDYSENQFNLWVSEGYPEPTMDNRLYDTYCRYNGGRYYSASSKQDPCHPCYVRNKIWENNCGVCFPANPESDRKKIGDDEQNWPCLQSGCCYADRAMDIH
jgi:hypothetical protein